MFLVAKTEAHTAINPLPAENTKDEVHDEEGPQHHHGDEIAELPGVTHGVLDLIQAAAEREGERRERVRVSLCMVHLTLKN